LTSFITGSLKAQEKISEIENNLKDFTGKSETPVSLTGEMAKYNVPGLGFAVIDQNNIAYEKYYGITRMGTEKLVTSVTLFEAASVTKMVTAILVMHFVEEGVIKLNDDINKYLKGWKIPPSEFTKESPITIDQILTHRAGFNRPEGGFSFASGTTGTLTDVLNGKYPAQNKPIIIETKPGNWNYSNFGYVVLQHLLEELSGKSYSVLAKELVFKPLNMNKSHMGLPLTEAQLSEKAYSHSSSGTQAQHGLQQVAFGHGALVTTPADLARLVRELMLSYMGKSDRILSRESSRKLIDNKISLDPAVLGGIEAGQGYGLMVKGDAGNICFLMAGQNFPGATCIVVGFPNTGQGAVVMTNSDMGELVQIEVVSSIGKVFNWPSSKVF
ncbi:MAG: serine hydrolase domain-containing protein, partial [Bacteroidales bacterium]